MRALRQLATQHSILTAYTDAAGNRRVATEAALIGVLQALGVDIESPEQAENLLKSEKAGVIEPVNIAWNGRATIALTLPKPAEKATFEARLENDEVLSGSISLNPVADRSSFTLQVPRRLPPGYHNLGIRIGRREFETMILSAPKKCYESEDTAPGWGVFLPIYALQSRRGWGGGDFTDFEELTRFIESRGGSIVATLPLLATFLGPGYPYDPSPYSPASRLFWNELYVDLNRIPETEQSERARVQLRSDELQSEIRDLREARLVDYRRLMALKRRVLEELAAEFFDRGSSERRASLAEFIQGKPAVEDYARFRAVTEQQQKGWPVWEERIRGGDVRGSDFDARDYRYHLYVQWITAQQLSSLSDSARSKGRGLYLDFPLGVHPDGFDVWRERDSFATGVSVGAPPDPFFTKGQNWGFPPLHARRIRELGYRYLIGTLRHHMQFAGVLRLDHVMALHRLYWIPRGAEATDGVYVRYADEELYAILAIESHRHRTMMVGEDLGTVPNYVRSAMARHNLHRMYVLQYEARGDAHPPVNEMIPGSVASLNTHDMPPFGAYWRASDVDSRIEMGLLDEKEARQARESRAKTREALLSFLRKQGFLGSTSEDPAAVHDACMSYLSRSSADVVLVNLEDLWLEREPQNIPGTTEEKPNWRRKARKTLEEIKSSPSVTLRLKSIDQNRKGRMSS